MEQNDKSSIEKGHSLLFVSGVFVVHDTCDLVQIHVKCIKGSNSKSDILDTMSHSQYARANLEKNFRRSVRLVHADHHRQSIEHKRIISREFVEYF